VTPAQTALHREPLRQRAHERRERRTQAGGAEYPQQFPIDGQVVSGAKCTRDVVGLEHEQESHPK
jgi:glycine cleavage system aminomethyltransferase T